MIYRDEHAGQKTTEGMIDDACTLATIDAYQDYELAKVRYDACRQRYILCEAGSNTCGA